MSRTLDEFLRECVFPERLQRFEDVLEHRTRHVAVVLENIYHAHNASACLRTCDCFGIQDVHVIETENAFDPNPDIALGASKWLSIHRYTQGSEEESPESANAATAHCYESLRAQGYRILATSPRQHSLPLSEVSIDHKTAIVFGAEQVGASDFAIDQADALVHIPMFGFTESFNVSVSAAIILQQLTMQLHTIGLEWRLSELEKQEIRELWVRRSLGAKVGPLTRRFEQENS